MRWKQFFTPVESLDASQAKDYITGKASKTITLLDVRQPGEYEAGHIPGAKLIPLPNLDNRMTEIDSEKPTIVYCAAGGRSRVAAQMLAGKGFKEVYNLSGGFKAWNSGRAFGQQDLGLELFTGKESPEETLVIAYSLEAGLRDFYLSMITKTKNENLRQLFEKLSTIEVIHQERIFNEYQKISGRAITQEEFANNTVALAVEGGLTTEEYVHLFQPDWGSVGDIIELAMSIEAQALDLYQRAADRIENLETQRVLMEIADEERAHLNDLGKLFGPI